MALQSAPWSYYIKVTNIAGVWTLVGTPWDFVPGFSADTSEPQWDNRLDTDTMLVWDL